MRVDQRQDTDLTSIAMSHDLQDEEAMAAEVDRYMAHVFDNWTSAGPVPMPKEPVYTFSVSAVPVGHFKEDLPDEVPSGNRKKDASAWLMVKRGGDKTGFLWCDTDGKPADKKYIQMASGLTAEFIKEQLVAMYNFQEMKLVEKYNWDINIAMGRRVIVKFAARGTAEPPVVDDEDRPGQYLKEYVFCSETDPELN